jgi:hypothetical protein
MLVQETTTYIGPARVIEIEAERIRVRIQERGVWASMAMGLEYEPEVGDQLLVLGQEEAYYIVGILHGTGTLTLSSAGNIHIRAPQGSIDLFAREGVNVRAARFNLKVKRLEILAQVTIEKCNRAVRWVRDCFQLRAGRMRTVVKEEYQVRADRIAEWAKRDVKIDGNKIHLG